MDLGCTGRKDGQTDSTRTREKKERQTEPSCRALLAGSRKALRTHTDGCSDISRETKGKLLYYKLLRI